MTGKGYKKYMKKNASKDYTLIKLFALSFFGMLLVFSMLIKSFSPSVDVSIGDYKYENEVSEETQKSIDERLSRIQDEDSGRGFGDLMKNAEDEKPVSTEPTRDVSDIQTPVSEKITAREVSKQPASEPIYKVFIGNYTSAEQAKVAKDIITESGSNLNPIVKCIGSNNYTLQVGLFKNKNSAEALLYTVQQNHLPGRIVQEY